MCGEGGGCDHHYHHHLVDTNWFDKRVRGWRLDQRPEMVLGKKEGGVTDCSEFRPQFRVPRMPPPPPPQGHMIWHWFTVFLIIRPFVFLRCHHECAIFTDVFLSDDAAEALLHHHTYWTAGCDDENWRPAWWNYIIIVINPPPVDSVCPNKGLSPEDGNYRGAQDW